MDRKAVSPNAKLAAFSDHWSPKIVSRFNGHDVMVVKVAGEFVWRAQYRRQSHRCR